MNELTLLRRIAEAGRELRCTAILDDDFPEKMHNFDSALHAYENAQKSGALTDVDNQIEVWIIAIKKELQRAIVKFPRWPNDPVHAAAVVAEEAGELVREVNHAVYEQPKATDVEAEAVQTGATVLRFLLGLRRYEFLPSVQHRSIER